MISYVYDIICQHYGIIGYQILMSYVISCTVFNYMVSYVSSYDSDIVV